jgi:hypothetical protein
MHEAFSMVGDRTSVQTFVNILREMVTHLNDSIQYAPYRYSGVIEDDAVTITEGDGWWVP